MCTVRPALGSSDISAFQSAFETADLSSIRPAQYSAVQLTDPAALGGPHRPAEHSAQRAAQRSAQQQTHCATK